MSKITIQSVLIADEIEQECIDCLQNSNVKVVKKTKLNEADLIAELKHFDAVIVRSATKISRSVISACASSLKLIGRAGTGVDNIDVEAATEYGVVVMNTPDAPCCPQFLRWKEEEEDLGQHPKSPIFFASKLAAANQPTHLLDLYWMHDQQQ
uniref:D-isomer specific 2-hydroxyacid dehydrogenase catalytic domain-containing protein n=1 Tax=Ditylenchus dipsaci TaxID=166011 RepID=A0A915D854_9BILA